MHYDVLFRVMEQKAMCGRPSLVVCVHSVIFVAGHLTFPERTGKAGCEATITVVVLSMMPQHHPGHFIQICIFW